MTALYKAAGLFGDLEINSTEFTPRDLYTLAFFNTNGAERPQACVEADPSLPHCQIMGRFRMEFPGYSTIKPYSHMAENCPTIAPDYYRPDGC